MDSKPQTEMSDDVKGQALNETGDFEAEQKLTRQILFKLDTR
jgi:hypothetical protein